jgi:hypothetical protein
MWHEKGVPHPDAVRVGKHKPNPAVILTTEGGKIPTGMASRRSQQLLPQMQTPSSQSPKTGVPHLEEMWV